MSNVRTFNATVTNVEKIDGQHKVSYQPENSSLPAFFVVDSEDALNPQVFNANAVGKPMTLSIDHQSRIHTASIEGTPVLDRSNDLTL